MFVSALRTSCALLLVAFSVTGNSFVLGEETTAEALFDASIAPILVKRCVECHHDQEPSGGLNLTNVVGLNAGGDSGKVIQPGSAAESYLVTRISAAEMPPAQKGISQALPPEEIAALRKWIDDGAIWPAQRILDIYESTSEIRAGRDWWSLQPIVKPDVPLPANKDRVVNPIDAFILDQLESANLQPAPLADRRTLIRRLYFDLLGLPPTFQEIDAFERDLSPDAYEKLVDALLDSPQFGQRWGRYWLDLVRYADTSGYERDQEKPFAWKYRDWVVDAINSDMPFDRFVLEQLAGDQLESHDDSALIATGFLRLGTWNDEPNEPEAYQYDRLEDLVDATSKAFFGLSVKCARCHNHKFDPILQADYYRMASAFWIGPLNERDRSYLGGPTAEELGVKEILGWTDTRPGTPLNLLKKGDPKRPEELISYAAIKTISNLADFGNEETSRTDVTITKRRLHLARWITAADQPLTPRVIVNRLWQHHFGTGIVRSPNNFGFRGDPPTHPELLDWLAAELQTGGWRLKPLHKLMLMSSTYRQSSNHPHYDAYAEQDFANRFWWRANRRRMDAEALRDAMLSVSGQLDTRLSGPSFKPTISPEALEGLSRKTAAWQESSLDEQRRRSLYSYVQRSLLPPLMTTFDFADTTLPCEQRDVTTVAPQALALLNNEFVHRQSNAVAKRIDDLQLEDKSQQVDAAWQLVLSRAPGQSERAASLRHLQRQLANFEQSPANDSTPEFLALASLCHALMNTNEFIYVD
jgi:hypothetical protein